MDCQLMYIFLLIVSTVQHHLPHHILTSSNTSTRFVILNPSFSNSLMLGMLDSDICVRREVGGIGKGVEGSTLVGAALVLELGLQI